ncbi:hypothetical protein Hypma_009045 [Hypsizygus marmoreus]|uniref:Uncharacterized protein n=1 Tax=Hypsizygus marmoreus TaxID=39966 RepID=A0A369JV30_HYPMA|nr:hypothetical protein Hypma_009045 [Hypsizygus marmoreus]
MNQGARRVELRRGVYTTHSYDLQNPGPKGSWRDVVRISSEDEIDEDHERRKRWPDAKVKDESG